MKMNVIIYLSFEKKKKNTGLHNCEDFIQREKEIE